MKKFISTILVIFLFVNIFAVAVCFAKSNEKVPVIIKFKDRSDAGLVKAFGGDIKHEYTIIPAIACSLPVQAIEALKRNPNIENIEPDHEFFAVDDILDWGVDHIEADIVHSSGITGAGVKVAVIDTGIDGNHVDLDDNIAGWIDYVNGGMVPYDDNGHGTHCSGTIAAEDNGVGVVGVAPNAKLYAAKILDSSGSGSESNLIAAIEWAVINQVNVISMSIGSNGATSSLEAMCNAAEGAGVLLVSAAGNDYFARGPREWDTVDYPGRFDSVVAVGATDQSDNKASFSSTGPDVEIAAPGVNILSTFPGNEMYPDGRLATGSGTSMATPHVAGVAALIFASPVDVVYDDGDGVWEAVEVRSVLQSTADDLGDAGRDYWYGYGLVDADEAAELEVVDTIAPVISNVAVSEIGLISATITWITDEPSDSIVNYGTLTNSLDSQEVSSSLVTIHSITLTGLVEDTNYFFEVNSNDAAGNTAINDNDGNYYMFTTLAPDTTPPSQVIGLSVTAVSDSQLDLTWDANPENDLDYYKVYRNGIFLATTTITSFSDTGLQAATTYYYIVSAVDTSGNEGQTSDEAQGTTLETPQILEMYASLDVSAESRSAGRNVFYSATATVQVYANDGPLASATVSGHWESATSDLEIGTTDANGIVIFYSDSVRNPKNALTFTFVIDDIVLDGYMYQPEQPQSDSTTIPNLP